MPLFNGDEEVVDDKGGASITNLVPTISNGGFQEAFLDPGTNRYFPAAILDFSKIDSSSITQLTDKYFSFVCGYGCGENFKFTFIDGDGTQSKRLGSTSQYEIDIHGFTTGQEIVDEIVKTTSTTTQYPTSPLTGVTQIAHRQALTKNGDKLIVIDTQLTNTDTATPTSGYATEAEASKGGRGTFDASHLNGTVNKKMVKTFPIQCSNIVSDVEYIRTEKMNTEVLGIPDLDVSTQTGAQNALARVEKASATISSQRSSLGAYQNRLEHSYANNENKAENTQAAESRIRDTDMAKEMVNFSKNNILQQAGTSMLAQANQSNQGVLSLLG